MRQKAPRLSASGAKKDDACPSSFTRSQEFYRFLLRHDIDGIASDPTTDRGTHIHAVCAAVPVCVEGFTPPPTVDRRTQIDGIYQELLAQGKVGKLSGFELFICDVFTSNRDLFIEHVIASHPLAQDPSVELELVINLDDQRLVLPFKADGEPFGVHEAWPTIGDPVTDQRVRSGLPDMHLVVRGGGISVVGIFDYKSGQQTYDPADNAQIDTLLALASIDEERRTGVAPVLGFGAFAYEANLRGDLDIARFSDLDLARVREKLIRTSKPAIQLSEAFIAENDDTPSGALSVALDKAAVVHEHCKHCDGKLCCGAWRQSMAQVEYGLTYKFAPLLSKNLQDPAGNVNTKTVSEILHISKALAPVLASYEKATELAEIVTRQLHAKGVAVENVTIGPGSKRTVLNGESLQEVMPLITAITGDDLLALAHYVGFKASASDLKTYLAARSGKRDRDMKDFLEGLGSQSPIVVKHGNPSVEAVGPTEDVIQSIAAEIVERQKYFESLKAADAAAAAQAAQQAPLSQVGAPAASSVPVAPVGPQATPASVAQAPASLSAPGLSAPASPEQVPTVDVAPVRKPRRRRAPADVLPAPALAPAASVEVPVPEEMQPEAQPELGAPEAAAVVTVPSPFASWG